MSLPLYFLISLSVVAVLGDDCHCPHVDTHYRELGCTPVQGSGCCPDRYDCSHLEGQSKDKCYINGQVFNIRERISDEVMNAPCSAGCFCREGYPEGSPAQITCAQVECFEPYDSNCVMQYNLNSCCRENKICDAEKIAALSTCEIDGKTFKEGEVMYLKSSPCKKCICSKDFTGNIEAPFCKPFSCGIVEHYSSRIQSNCAPIFSTNGCCPNEFRCHEESDVIVSGTSINLDDPKMACKFGNKTLNVGDTFDSKRECVTCGCFVPPLASCISDAECQKKRHQRFYFF